MSLKFKVFGKFLGAVGAIFSVLSLIAFANSAPSTVAAYGMDTIAGYSTTLRTSQTAPNAKVFFEVVDPRGETLRIPAYANSNGIARAELQEFYTEAAGTYEVRVVQSEVSNSQSNYFEVFAGNTSPKISSVSPEYQVVEGNAPGSVAVALQDNYGNPVAGHIVQLVASDSCAKSKSVDGLGVTNENGEIFFEVSSDCSSAVTYIAYDTTADVVLNERAEVAYFDSAEQVFAKEAPGAYYHASLGNSSGPIDHFEFEEVPQEVYLGDEITMTVSAYDVLDQAVTDYDGEIRFSVTSNTNTPVTLPADYTFVPEDLGSHAFSLAFIFHEIGSYVLEVRDIADTSVYGEFLIDVFAKPGGSVEASGITISSPIDGGVYSNNVQIISGTAEAGIDLLIFDNDVAIAETTADISGNFSFSTDPLEDGEHVIYIASVNEVGTIIDTSDSVSFSVDTSGPTEVEVFVEPEEIEPYGTATVKLYSDEQLDHATVIFEGGISPMIENIDGSYEATISAPGTAGQYSVNFVLVDELGNEMSIEDEIFLKVKAPMEAVTEQVGDVYGVIAEPFDRKVVLNWVAPSSVNSIKNYRIYYGISSLELSNVVDTFTDATTWYIPNLQNDVTYYFAVTALDSLGNESAHLSEIVSATPFSTFVAEVDPCVTNGVCGSEALEDLEEDVSNSGPEMWWLLVLSVLGGGCYSRARKRREAVRVHVK